MLIQEKYCHFGTNFLLTSSPDSLYWGRFISEFNDSIILEMLKLCAEQIVSKKSVTIKKKNSNQKT